VQNPKKTYTNQEVEGYKKNIKEQALQIAFLQEELAQLKRMIFGSKSERFIAENDSQLSLFEAEQKERITPKEETISYNRKKASKDKNKAKRLFLPAHLPREEELIEPYKITESSKKIGEEVTEILEYNPGNLHVRRIVRPKYVNEQKGCEPQIIIAELPSLPIPKGNAGAGLLAHLMVSKFVDHLPFYRIRQQFKRQGVDLAESTMNGWYTSICKLLSPLYDTLIKETLKADYLMADETPLPVLTKDKPGSTHKGYHWVYVDPVNKNVCFDYRKGRGREGPKSFLKDFSGSLQTDGYVAYDEFGRDEKITLLACMAHARRKFEQALDTNKSVAELALSKIQELYAIEREAKENNYSYLQRKELRQEKVAPLLEEFEQWLKKKISATLPKSKIGMAMSYTLKFWPRLKRYVDNGKYEIDNNLVENTIRPVAIGRKNYLFAGSHQGAQQAAIMYSFLGTCKLNKVEPFAWLKKVLEVIPEYKANKLVELLPANLIL